jgi:hypothetical protein
MSKIWYYGRGTAQIGPLSLEELRTHLIQDGNTLEAFVWREGFESWKRAPEVPELFPTQPPPLPSSAKRTPNAQPRPVPEETSGWKKAAGIAASIVGGLIGLSLSKALGSVFWMPAIAVAVVWWALSRSNAPSWAVPMLTLAIGQTTWIAVGIIILASIGKTTADHFFSIADVVIVVGLAFWVLKAQTKSACIGVLIYEVIALGMNVVTLNERSEDIATAMVIHIILRLCGIAATIYALYKRPSSVDA